MRVRVDGPGGVEELELELSLDALTMRESVRLEQALGGETFDKLMAGELTETDVARPSFIQALLYVKLKTLRPELEVDGFDVDLEGLNTELEGLAPTPKPGSESKS